MSKWTVRVESIFDVALTKLLLDNLDISLVNPSDDQKQLLGATPDNTPHDVHIGDMEYRSGVQIKGSADYVREIETLLRDQLPDSIVFQHPVQQDAIYYAKVIKYIYRKRLAILDLGNDQKGIMFNVKTEVGDYHLVQVKELTTEKDKLPVLEETITLSGDYVILEVGSSFVRISRKIKGDQRQDLHEYGKQILPEGYGIIIRTSAKSVDKEKILSEIEELRDQWEQVCEEVEHQSYPSIMIEGEKVSEIILGNASKVHLDKLRGELETTLPNYYQFKSYSMASGFTADFAQNYVEQQDPVEMGSRLEKMIIERDYPINNHVKAEFKKLDGTKDEFIIGNIIENDGVIVTRTNLSREFKEDIPIFEVNPDDILEIHFIYGSWTIHYKYYSSLTNQLLGEELRIITPLDFVYRGRIRTFDTGMKIYKNPSGETTSQVDDSTSNMVENGMISKSLDDKLGEVLHVAMRMLQEDEEQILIHLGQ